MGNRRSWWSQPTTWDEVCRRAKGREKFNAMRRRWRDSRRREVLQLWLRWGGKPGTASLIATHLHVHRSTVGRDLRALGLGSPRCPTCGRLRPRPSDQED